MQNTSPLTTPLSLKLTT